MGIGKETFWNGVVSEKVAVGVVDRFDTTGYRSRLAAQIDDFDPADFLSERRRRWTDRFSQFAVAAARLALDDARFTVNGERGDIGVYIGSALGGVAYADEQHDVFRAKGLDGVRPLLAISVFGGASTCNVSIEFGLTRTDGGERQFVRLGRGLDRRRVSVDRARRRAGRAGRRR